MRESRETQRQLRERARRFEAEDNRRQHRIRRRKKKKSNKLPLVIAALVIAAIAVILLGNVIMEELGSSRERQDIASYFDLTSPDDNVLIINGERSEEKAMIQNGTVYLPIRVANSLYDNFYYDSIEGHLLVTGATRTTEGVQGSDYIPGDTVYISLAFLNRFCPMSYEIYEEPYRIVIATTAMNTEKIGIADDTVMRVSADKKSPILYDLEKGAAPELLESGENWSRVRYQAVDGYVENKALDGNRTAMTVSLSGGNEADADYQRILRQHKIVMGFHNIAVADANAYFADATANVKGMNVIAPTWLSMSDNEGHLNDIGSAEYVNRAHEKGYEVWAVVDNFSPDMDSNEVLSRTSARAVLEQELIERAKTYGLDGINIDFEQLKGETGDDFAQFLRELSILTRANGLVLSVDNYVPQDYTGFYRRDIQGRVADYVVIMGYDEHTMASNEAGSVASLGFVTQGIEDTLKEVPAAQVINAIPFYTRKWAFEEGVLSCESLGMTDARAFLADNGVQASWDAETCQNYASFEKNGVLYSIWLEDAESISSKLAVMASHDLGGVACWKLTQETPDIWDMITTYYPVGQ